MQGHGAAGGGTDDDVPDRVATIAVQGHDPGAVEALGLVGNRHPALVQTRPATA